jgi:hypothetical protein
MTAHGEEPLTAASSEMLACVSPPSTGFYALDLKRQVDASILYRLLQCFASDYASRQNATCFCFRNVLLDGQAIEIAIPPGYPKAWVPPRQGHLTFDFVSYQTPPKLQMGMSAPSFRLLVAEVRVILPEDTVAVVRERMRHNLVVFACELVARFPITQAIPLVRIRR